jgi:transmembrane sensor
MNKHSDRLHYLYQRYINRACTHEEMQELFVYVADPEWKDQLEAIAGEHLEQLQIPERLPEVDWDYMYQQIITPAQTTALNGNNRRGMIRWFTGKRMAAAAIVFILLAAGGYWWLNRLPKTDLATTDKKPAATTTVDIAPGGNKAILTLANGTTISLTDAANGTVAKEGTSVVSKTKDGELVYQSAIGNASTAAQHQSAIVYNTLATPRGGQYQLVLPDGSKVWLNAASSIRYPTVFTGTERKVAITGEAYFEVVHNSQMPFVVEKGNMAVEVLGTHFNINAYDDEEAIKTTLLEGKVKVGSGEKAEGRWQMADKEQSVVLKPGEQVSLSHTSQLSQPIPVQTEEVMAWKNGLFQFENADIRSVMRQLSRWYDVDIAYKQPSELKDKVSIEFPRTFNLSDVLKIMESTAGVKLQMEGKKIIVL